MAQNKDRVVDGVRVKEQQETVLRSYRLPIHIDAWLTSRVPKTTTQTDSLVGILMERYEQESKRKLGDKQKTGTLRK